MVRGVEVDVGEGAVAGLWKDLAIAVCVFLGAFSVPSRISVEEYCGAVFSCVPPQADHGRSKHPAESSVSVAALPALCGTLHFDFSKLCVLAAVATANELHASPSATYPIPRPARDFEGTTGPSRISQRSLTHPSHSHHTANPHNLRTTANMSHESVWYSRPRTYGKGSRAWYVRRSRSLRIGNVG